MAPWTPYGIDYMHAQINNEMPDRRANLNDDREINDGDIEQLLVRLGITNGDADANGHVELTDFNLLAINYDQRTSATTAVVPEPSTFGLLVGAYVLVGRRRR